MKIITGSLFALSILFITPAVIQAQQPTGSAAIPAYVPSDPSLHREIATMDSLFFEAYNSCDIALQSNIYASDIEFFHDKGGLSTSKTDILASTEENICGKVTRTLVDGSLEVYPIAGYGAVEIGYHKFFNNQEPDAPSHPSKFIIVWKKEGDSWQITKVISLH
jgi:ketosteroid isomerase-like protein